MLRVFDLALSYGASRSSKASSMEVEDGEFVSLVGPSGSGKISLLRAVIGLQTPLGRHGRARPSMNARSASCSRTTRCCRGGRARENVALGLRLRGMPSARGAGAGRRLARPARPRTASAIAIRAHSQRRAAQARRPRAGAGARAAAAADGRAVRVARCDRARAASSQDLLDAGRAGAASSVLLVTHDLEEALSAVRQRLSAVAGAAGAHRAALSGADPAAARLDQGAHASGLRAAATSACGATCRAKWIARAGQRRLNAARSSPSAWIAAARRPSRCCWRVWELAARRRHAQPAVTRRAEPDRRGAGSSCSPTARSGRISKRRSPPRSAGSRSASSSASCSASSRRWCRSSPNCSSR